MTDYQNFDVKTHLGDVLKVGSSVLGYELSSLNLSSPLDHSMLKNLPDVILVKKSYSKNLKKRIWKLKQLEKDEEEAETKFINLDNDYEEFLNDLETDPEMRSHVNLYRNEKTIKEKETDQMVDENEPQKNSKKKLKVKRKSNNRQPLAAAGGKDNENNDDEDDKDQDENKDSNTKEVKKKEEVKENEEKDEDDALVRIEELLADLTLEDQIVEDNDDAIEEFIRRLENVRIEGKE
jgi:nonsense-mediated mRNA decay protein 3